MSRTNPRQIDAASWDDEVPVYVVWELTQRCDQRCAHCGSRAGSARTQELDTDALLEVARALGRLGCREVTLLGGEIYLRDDTVQVVEVLAEAGVHVSILTGGRRFRRDYAEELVRAGVRSMAVSIDGPEPVHEALRGVPGGFELAVQAVRTGLDLGLSVGVNTQINRLNLHLVREMAELVRGLGVGGWQVQLTTPMGRAADDDTIVVQPWEMLDLVRDLAYAQWDALALAAQSGEAPFEVFAADDMGYYGPYEQLLRGRPGQGITWWRGCHAAKRTLGVQADGTIKPCLSMPTSTFECGSVLDQPLETIWAQAEGMHTQRARTVEDLSGFCRTCAFAETCLGGCLSTSFATLGRQGDNPFCWHRAHELRTQGLRERLVRVREAPQDRGGFDHGAFDLVLEPWPDPS